VDSDPLLNQNYQQTAVHELTHIAINRAYRDVSTPRWLHEGLALHFSYDLSMEEHLILSWAILSNSLLALDSIEQVNSFSRRKARIAYCQSRQAVRYLIKRYGTGTIPALLNQASRQHSFGRALDSAIGMNSAEFEAAVRAQILADYRYALFFAETWLFWMLATIIFIIGFIATGIRRRRKLAAMAAQEQDDSDPSPQDTPSDQA
ncbi:MAG: hypothetical protein GF398_00965, partial [Chitinivibrionales bacterium]|nr:hypothetical protein [Chitinivibrionales bacterium]